MDLRGQRFTVDLSDEEEESTSGLRTPADPPPTVLSAFIGDIKERSTAPPTAPKIKTTPTGFPEHKKRTRVSAFKQQRAGAVKSAPETGNAFALPTKQDANKSQQPFEEEERKRIDEENKQRLADMSAEEINEERQDLFSHLDPSLIERLLKRANLDDGRGDTGFGPLDEKKEQPSEESEPTSEAPEASVPAPPATENPTETSTPAPVSHGRPITTKSVTFTDDLPPSTPIDLQPASLPLQAHQPAIHFPSPTPAPDLDPSSPSFLTTLHEKYYPSLPSDPSKLAWMAPLPTPYSPADRSSPYFPSSTTLSASSLRFDFRGALLPPRISRAMPTTRGLHHHGEAPEAAGYTIPELARLARSVFPAQRCIAFQTLGRVLYRLGRGEWGAGGEIEMGLWKCVEEGGVVATLEEAAASEGGHAGARAYAVEALWLWRRGGGKVWKAT